MRVKTFSLILFFALLLALSTYAQEPTEPPPTAVEPTIPPATETLIPPSPTELPIPTETSVPIPTETATPSFTPTSTDTGIPVLTEILLTTATSELTLSPTESSAFTATPTPSLTASLQPTFDPFATIEAPFTTQIYDNFDSGTLGIWQIGAGWSLVPNEGGQALQAQNTLEPVVMDDDTLYNASIQVRVLLNTGAIRLFLRQSEMGDYSAALDADGNVSLYRGTELLGSAQVAASEPGQWRTFRFSAVEDLLRVWVDDVEIGSMSDKSPLPQGRIGLSDDGKETINLTVDDVVVAWEAFMFSSLELQSTSTPTPTLTGTWVQDFVFNTPNGMQGWTILNGTLDGISGWGQNVGVEAVDYPPQTSHPHRAAISLNFTIPSGSLLTSMGISLCYRVNGSRFATLSLTGGDPASWTFAGDQAPQIPLPQSCNGDIASTSYRTLNLNRQPGNYTAEAAVYNGGDTDAWLQRVRFTGQGVNPFTFSPTPTPTLNPTLPFCPVGEEDGGAFAPVCQEMIGVIIEKNSLDAPAGFEDVNDDPDTNPVSAGEMVNFTITVINTSGVDATNLIISDPLSLDLLNPTVTTSVGTYDVNTGNWSIPSLPNKNEVNSGEAVLTISAQAGAENLPLGTTITNTAAITDIQPTNIPVLQEEDSANLIIVCEGTLNSSANTYTAPSITAPFTGSPLGNGAEAAVIGYTRTTDSYSTSADYSYGWFQITNRLLSGYSTPRFVKARQVVGCDHLKTSFSFDDEATFSTDTSVALPAVSGENIPCTDIPTPETRRECAEQVYVAFYNRFLEKTLRAPTLRDVLGFFLAREVSAFEVNGLPEDLATATALNVYLGYCVQNSSGRTFCTGSELIDLLSQSDAWIQIGDENQVNPARLEVAIDAILMTETQSKLDLVIDDDGMLDGMIQVSGQTPIKWGNYYYFTDGHLAIRGGSYTPMFCSLVQKIEIDEAGNRIPIDYIFAVIAAENPPVFSTNYASPSGAVPSWFTSGQEPLGSYVDCGIPWTP